MNKECPCCGAIQSPAMRMPAITICDGCAAAICWTRTSFRLVPESDVQSPVMADVRMARHIRRRQLGYSK